MQHVFQYIFMLQAWKVCQGHLGIGSSVCPEFHPAYKVQYLKFGLSYSNQTWTAS